MGLAELLSSQLPGLTIGGAAVGIAWCLNEWRQHRAALHEERRAEREAFDVRAKALEGALQAQEKTVAAHQQRADLFEEKAQQLQEHLDAVLDAHVTLHDEYEELRSKLEDCERSDRTLLDMMWVLLISNATTYNQANELDEKFRKHWTDMEARLRADILDLFEVDPGELERLKSSSTSWPLNYLHARVALLQLREAVLLGRMQALALRSNISLTARVWDLKHNDRGLTGEPLLAAIKNVVEEHKVEVMDLVNPLDEYANPVEEEDSGAASS